MVFKNSIRALDVCVDLTRWTDVSLTPQWIATSLTLYQIRRTSTTHDLGRFIAFLTGK